MIFLQQCHTSAGAASASGYASNHDWSAGIVLISVEETKGTQPDNWIGTIEISWSDEKAPTVFHPAFTVVTTWAASPEEFREKCVRRLESYAWRLLEVAQANPVPNEGEFSEEVEDMLARARTIPNAIIYDTFRSYPVM
jgi:hypothetical protein